MNIEKEKDAIISAQEIYGFSWLRTQNCLSSKCAHTFFLLPQLFSRLRSRCNDSRMKTRHKRKIIISRWKISTIIKWSSKHDTATHDVYGNFSCGQTKKFLILMSNFLALWRGGWLTLVSRARFEVKRRFFSFMNGKKRKKNIKLTVSISFVPMSSSSINLSEYKFRDISGPLIIISNQLSISTIFFSPVTTKNITSTKRSFYHKRPSSFLLQIELKCLREKFLLSREFLRFSVVLIQFNRHWILPLFAHSKNFPFTGFTVGITGGNNESKKSFWVIQFPCLCERKQNFWFLLVFFDHFIIFPLLAQKLHRNVSASSCKNDFH